MDDIQAMTSDERRLALLQIDRAHAAHDYYHQQRAADEAAHEAYIKRLDAEYALEQLRPRQHQPGWSAQDQAALQQAYARLGPLVPEPRSDSGVRITIGQTDLLQGQTLRRED